MGIPDRDEEIAEEEEKEKRAAGHWSHVDGYGNDPTMKKKNK